MSLRTLIYQVIEKAKQASEVNITELRVNHYELIQLYRAVHKKTVSLNKVTDKFTTKFSMKT